jgi:lipopolysaccharide transport system ATP-binding protein
MQKTTEDTEFALICDDVSKVFLVSNTKAYWQMLCGHSSLKKILALEHVSLNIPKGEVVGIIGNNGSGKSTLLRIMGGNYTATNGSVYLEGSLTGIFELGGIGNPNLTGRGYAARLLSLQGAKRKDLKVLLDEIYEFSELFDYFDAPIYTYSSGMRARLYFATATTLDWDIYLIDEALSVGDEHFQAKCWQRIRKRLLQGASGVLVTHDFTAILKLCSSACILERGRLMKSAPTLELVRFYIQQSATKAESLQGATFDKDMPKEWIVNSGEDVEIYFTIHLTLPVSVSLAYTIEMFVPGIGWEVMMMQVNLPLTSKVGTHKVCLKIPKLPLSSGRYLLGLALCKPAEAGKVFAIGYDGRNWISGSPLYLIVQNTENKNVNACDNGINLPLKWNRLENLS